MTSHFSWWRRQNYFIFWWFLLRDFLPIHNLKTNSGLIQMFTHFSMILKMGLLENFHSCKEKSCLVNSFVFFWALFYWIWLRFLMGLNAVKIIDFWGLCRWSKSYHLDVFFSYVTELSYFSFLDGLKWSFYKKAQFELTLL